MITVKIGQILGGFQSGALSRLANASLPMRTALRLKTILKTCENAMKDYDNERIEVCKEYGTMNAETSDYDIEPEKRLEFEEKANALLQNEITLNVEPITPSQLLSSASITANDLMILSWLIQTEDVQAVGK